VLIMYFCFALKMSLSVDFSQQKVKVGHFRKVP
jgi:hypothetical protein